MFSIFYYEFIWEERKLGEKLIKAEYNTSFIKHLLCARHLLLLCIKSYLILKNSIKEVLYPSLQMNKLKLRDIK